MLVKPLNIVLVLVWWC